MRFFWIVLIPAVLAGCAGGLGSGDYERAEARRVYDVKMGVVQHVRSVKLEGTKSGIGAGAGGIIGGIGGSTVGSGKGSAIGAVVGAVVGGLAGAATEEASTRKPALEITVQLDSGQTIAVVQEDNDEKFVIGERVRILESGGQARVSR